MIEGYVYKILFEDGCWYWGTSTYKEASPESDGYYGSPVTHKEHWSIPHSKIVVKVFSNETERLDYEEACILPDLDNPKCLNEHATRCFSRETCKRGGQAAAQKSRGVPRTLEVKKKISEKLSGRALTPQHVQKLKEAERPPVTQESVKKRVESRKGYRHSTETKQKMSESSKGKPVSLETRSKISESVKGFKWYNNGVESIQAYTHPGKGWAEGRILNWDSPRNKGMQWYNREGRNKLFKEHPGEDWQLGRFVPKGKRYYNDGTNHVLAAECPGDGWVPGRLKRR